MTYGELINLVRQDYLGDVADTPDLPDEDYRWPTDFLIRSLYEAERQVCMRKPDSIYDETTTAIVNPTITESQRYMSVDARIIDIAWMTIGTSHQYSITKTTRERLDQDEPAWRQNTDTTYPTRFYMYANKVYWDLLPSATCAADTCNLGVWRYPLAEKDLEQEPEVQGHRDLIHWVLWECYSKDDPDWGESRNDELAKKHLLLFNEAFGSPMGHNVLASKQESPRYVSSIGPNYFGNMQRRGRGLR